MRATFIFWLACFVVMLCGLRLHRCIYTHSFIVCVHTVHMYLHLRICISVHVHIVCICVCVYVSYCVYAYTSAKYFWSELVAEPVAQGSKSTVALLSPMVILVEGIGVFIDSVFKAWDVRGFVRFEDSGVTRIAGCPRQVQVGMSMVCQGV